MLMLADSRRIVSTVSCKFVMLETGQRFGEKIGHFLIACDGMVGQSHGTLIVAQNQRRWLRITEIVKDAAFDVRYLSCGSKQASIYFGGPTGNLRHGRGKIECRE